MGTQLLNRWLTFFAFVIPHYLSFRSLNRVNNNVPFHLYETVISSDILSQYYDELISLRGTPEMVDKLVNLASKYPGFEVYLAFIACWYAII